MSDEVKINRTIRLSPSLIKKVKRVSDDFSEWIRIAIEEKLARNKVDEEEYRNLMEQLKKLDPLFLQKQVSDMQLTGVALFEETKKQNEALKLILRRATFSSMFSYQLLAKNEPVKISLHEKEAKAQINEDLTIIDL